MFKKIAKYWLYSWRGSPLDAAVPVPKSASDGVRTKRGVLAILNSAVSAGAAGFTLVLILATTVFGMMSVLFDTVINADSPLHIQVNRPDTRHDMVVDSDIALLMDYFNNGEIYEPPIYYPEGNNVIPQPTPTPTPEPTQQPIHTPEPSLVLQPPPQITTPSQPQPPPQVPPQHEPELPQPPPEETYYQPPAQPEQPIDIPQQPEPPIILPPVIQPPPVILQPPILPDPPLLPPQSTPQPTFPQPTPTSTPTPTQQPPHDQHPVSPPPPPPPVKQPQAPLVVTAASDVVTFGEDPFMLDVSGGSGTGALSFAIIDGGEALLVNPITGLVTIVGVGNGNAKIRVTRAGDDNFDPITEYIEFEVLRATLTVAARTATIVYGDPVPPNFLYSIWGFVNGDDRYDAEVIIGTPEFTTQYILGNPVGNYPVIIADGTLYAPNYEFVFIDAELIVMRAPLTITAHNAYIAYGDVALDFEYSISGFVLGEDHITANVTGNAELTTNYIQGDAPDNYDIIVGVGTLYAPNYEFVILNDGILSVGLPAQPDLFLTTTTDETVFTYNVEPIVLSVSGGIAGNAITFVRVNGSAINVTPSGDVTILGVGTATIRATKTGGTTYRPADAYLTIEILPKPIDHSDITVFIESAVYTGAPQNPTIIITDDGGVTATLQMNVDFTLAYIPPTAVGDHIITINGIGNYDGTRTEVFTIEDAQVMTVPVAGDIIFGQALSDSVLSFTSNAFGTFAWETPNYQPSAGANQAFNMVFTPNASMLSFAPAALELYPVTITVDPQPLDPPTNVTFNQQGYITFTAGANNAAAGAVHMFAIYMNGDMIAGDIITGNLSSPDAENIVNLMRNSFLSEAITAEYAVTVLAVIDSDTPNFSATSGYDLGDPDIAFAESAPSATVYAHAVGVTRIGRQAGETINGRNVADDLVVFRAFAGESVTLTANPNTDRQVSWSGAGTASGDDFVVGPITSSVPITATFMYSPVSMASNGGTPVNYNTLAEAFDAASAAGNHVIRLYANLPMTAPVTIASGANITLVGETIPRYINVNYGHAFVIQNNATLTLHENIHLVGNPASPLNTSLVQVNGGTLNMNDTAVIRNHNGVSVDGAAVTITGATSVFNMMGGEIRNNSTALNAGGVNIINGGTFNMSGGSITDNAATGNGAQGNAGGVRVAEGTFNMNGGLIARNQATSPNAAGGMGGGVQVINGLFNISGGIIAGSTNYILLPRDGGVNSASGGATAALSTATDATRFGTFSSFPNGFAPVASIPTGNSSIEIDNGVLIRPNLGSGTATDPFLIWNEYDLRFVGRGGAERPTWTVGAGVHYRVMADITLTSNWTPIPAISMAEFDGNGHIISGLNATDTTGTSNLGLFDTIGNGGRVHNLGLVNVNIAGGSNSGGVAGEIIPGSIIENVFVTGILSGAENNAGGIVGRHQGGTVQHNVTMVIVDGHYSSGGIAGGLAPVLGTMQHNVVLGHSMTSGVNDGSERASRIGHNIIGMTLNFANDLALVDGYVATTRLGGGNSNGFSITSAEWSQPSWWTAGGFDAPVFTLSNPIWVNHPPHLLADTFSTFVPSFMPFAALLLLDDELELDDEYDYDELDAEDDYDYDEYEKEEEDYEYDEEPDEDDEDDEDPDDDELDDSNDDVYDYDPYDPPKDLPKEEDYEPVDNDDDDDTEPDPELETDYEPLTPEDIDEIENDMKDLEEQADYHYNTAMGNGEANTPETDYYATKPDDYYKL
ncbi:MAG: hypothetical protein FWC89_03600 [Defluviitaleaceae bacterium]|nr:hypothetical protein [Defluviitaleaceae bacterium]